MDDQTRRIEQARYLFETVRLLQRRILRRHGLSGIPRGEGMGCCADLTVPQLQMMMVVQNHDALSLKELAQALQVSAPSASAMVDRLVDLGMLTREPSQVDRREIVVGLSDEGRKAVGNIQEGILHSIIELLERIGPDYAARWCDVYQRVRMVLAEEDTPHEHGSEHVEV